MHRIFTSIAKSLLPPRLVRHRLDKKGKGAVLLTFDDGPHPEITLRVLDLLDRYGARALFFIPGFRADNAPELIREIIKRGHTIGNHSFSHDIARCSFAENKADMERCQEKLHALSGVAPKYFRPPQGTVNLRILLAAKYLNLRIMRWSIDTGEYSDMRGAAPDEIAGRLLQNINDRAIVLSHDDSKKTPDVLNIVLPALVEMGYDLKRGIEAIG